MVESTGLLNRRTGNTVPQVRILSSPLCQMGLGPFGKETVDQREWKVELFDLRLVKIMPAYTLRILSMPSPHFFGVSGQLLWFFCP